MKTYTLLSILLFTAFVLISCTKEYSTTEPLMGYWSYAVSNESPSELILHRTNGLDSNHFGLAFLSKKKGIYNYGGDCATPPVFYEEVGMKWKQESENTITIEFVEYSDSYSVSFLDDDTIKLERRY